MKCKYGKELGPINWDGMCLKCYNQNKVGYCKTEKLHTGWECPKCGHVWAVWVEGCSNCNQPEYKVTTTDGTSEIKT